MYCNNCGTHNPKDSKFCKKCGTKIINLTSIKNPSTIARVQTTDISSKNANTGIGGWLVLVGLGLLGGILMHIIAVFEYLPLIKDTYDVPGYLTLLQFEFFFTILSTLLLARLLYLYLQTNYKFPKYFIIYSIYYVLYALIDHFFLGYLIAPTQEMQKVIDDTLSQNIGEIAIIIITTIIWISYMNTSMRVKATFVNDN